MPVKNRVRALEYALMAAIFACAADGSWAVAEIGGTVRIEAESPTANITRTVSDPVNGTGDYAWTTAANIGGFGGSGLVQALPNDGTTVTANWNAGSPELQYTVDFANAGTYYVWLRGYGEGDEALSVYVGLDGNAANGGRIDLPRAGVWVWSGTLGADGSRVAVTVAEPGTHTFNVWMRGAGFALDRLVLTLSQSYEPERRPGFWKGQSIYQIITDRFFNGDPSNDVSGLPYYSPSSGSQAHGGDFKGIEKKLDYIKALGATAIWISPVVKNANGDYHGYAGTDFYAVNPRMGTLADLRRLVAEAHKRGLLVINDVVANHGGTWVDSAATGWPAFLYPPNGYSLRYNSGGREYAAPFSSTNLLAAYGNTSLSNVFHNNGGISNYGDAIQVELGELSTLDDFRTETPYVRARMKEIWSYWLDEAEFDAYRVDTVKHVEMGFWDEWAPVVRANAEAGDRPNFFMFGEVFDGSDSKCGSYTGTRAGGNYKMDSVLDYPLYYQIGSVFASAGGSTGQIEGRYGNLNTNNYDAGAVDSLVLNLDNHDNPRFLSEANGGTVARLEVALAFLYTSKGIPSLYYGTEQDFDGGADPACREDMFDGQYESGPSNGDNFNMTGPRFKLVAKLNNLRRLYPALREGSHVNLWANFSGPGLLAYARRLGNEEVYVVLNTASVAQTVGARPTIHPAGTVLVNVFDPSETYTVGGGTDGIPSIVMPPSSYKIFVSKEQAKPLAPMIEAVSPAHDAAGISTGAGITVTFDRAMDPASVQSAFSTVPTTSGGVTWSGDGRVMTYTPTAMTGDTPYVVRVEGGKAADGTGDIYAPFESRFTTGAAGALAKPSINSFSSGGVTGGGATLSATVTPNGSVTTVVFEYGEDNSYGFVTTPTSIGSGSSPIGVESAITGLRGGVTYHFRVVAANGQGTSYGPDATFATEAAGAKVVTKAAGGLTPTSATLNGNVDAGGVSTTIWFEYGANPEQLDFQTFERESGGGGETEQIGGLEPDTTYYFRINARSGGVTVSGSVLTFTTLAVKPGISAVGVGGVGPSTATFEANVSPNGSDTYVWFEYGADAGYGMSTTAQTVTVSGGAGSTVKIAATGLLFGQGYHFRAVAQNSFGITIGADQTFSTGYPAPDAVTGAASAVTTTSAGLGGTVNPNGSETIYWHEYGPTTAYGLSTKSQAGDNFESYTTTTLNYSSTSAGATVAANGGSGFGKFTSYVKTTSAGTINPSRGGVRCVAAGSINGTAGRQIDGANSLGVYAGTSTTSGAHSGFRALSAPRKFGQILFSVRFDISNAKGFTGVNLKSAAGSTFGANELLSVGMMPATGGIGGNTGVVVTDRDGQKNVILGSELRGAILDFRIDFDTSAGTYVCGVKLRGSANYTNVSGTLKLSGGSVNVAAIGYINGNNTGATQQHMILDGLAVNSSATAGASFSPLAASAAVSGLTPNLTYHYRLVAQNSHGTTAGADAVFYTGANAPPTISSIPDQTTNRNESTGAIPFSVGDVETDAGSLVVTGSSGNKGLVPDSGIVFGGAGAQRTVTVTPSAGATGKATISLTAGDGSLSATTTFLLTVNSPPDVTDIPEQILDEDSSSGAIPFSVGDTETAPELLTVEASSDNQSLLPDSGVSIGGQGAGRSVTLTPSANANGVAIVTLAVGDGMATAKKTFRLVVNAVNDPPTIAALPNRNVGLGEGAQAIPIFASDVDSAETDLHFSARSSNQILVSDSGLRFDGAGGSRTLLVEPSAGMCGSATIHVEVGDGLSTASSSFVLAVNGAPTIGGIADQTVDEDAGVGPFGFIVGDEATPAEELIVTATSSNQGLLPDAGISLGGTGSNRTISATISPDAHGETTVTLFVSDGQARAATSFKLLVIPVNDPPRIFGLLDSGIPAGTTTGEMSFAVDDVDTDVGGLTVSAASDNQSLVPVSGIAFGGEGGARTITVTPVPDASGKAKITVTVSDGEGAASGSFVLTVSKVNTPPKIGDIGDRTVFVGRQLGPLAFTVQDSETSPTELVVTGTSSDQSLIPDADITFGGSGGFRTVTVVPLANRAGTATVTVTVEDGEMSQSETFVVAVVPPPDIFVALNRGEDGAGDAAYTGGGFDGKNGGFGFKPWTALAQGIGGAYLDTGADGTKSFAIYAGGGAGNSYSASRQFGGAMSEGESFGVRLGYTAVNSGGEVGVKLYSGGMLRLVLRLAPSAEATWQLNDGGSYFSTGIANSPGTPLLMRFTRNAGNGYDIRLSSGAQVMSGINYTGSLGTMSIDRVDFYSTEQGAGWNFRFAEIERFLPLAAGVGEIDFGEARVGASNALRFSIRNEGEGPLGGLTVGAEGVNGGEFVAGGPDVATLPPGGKTEFQIVFGPRGQGVRRAAISVESDDPDENPFRMAVAGTGLNDAPAIGPIPDQSLNEDTGTGAVPFVIGDPETDPDTLEVSAASGDETLIPHENIILGGNGANRTISVTPAAGRSGTTTVTVTVSDGDRTVAGTFTVTVAPVNGTPSVGAIGDQESTVGTPTEPIPFTVRDDETEAELLLVSVSSDNQGVVPDSGLALGGEGGTRTLAITAASAGRANITIVVSDGDSSSSRTFAVDALPPAGFGGWSVLPLLPAERRGAGDKNGPQGIPNLQAYAMGLNPLDAKPGDVPMLEEAEGSLAISFRRARGTGDVTISVLSSDSADAGWTSIWSSSTNAFGGGTNDFETVTVKDTVPIKEAPAGRRFMRVRVTRP